MSKHVEPFSQNDFDTGIYNLYCALLRKSTANTLGSAEDVPPVSVPEEEESLPTAGVIVAIVIILVCLAVRPQRPPQEKILRQRPFGPFGGGGGFGGGGFGGGGSFSGGAGPLAAAAPDAASESL